MISDGVIWEKDMDIIIMTLYAEVTCGWKRLQKKKRRTGNDQQYQRIYFAGKNGLYERHTDCLFGHASPLAADRGFQHHILTAVYLLECIRRSGG